jgi:hypothetical protein
MLLMQTPDALLQLCFNAQVVLAVSYAYHKPPDAALHTAAAAFACQVLRRQALVKGHDVHEVDCWGMDCYTRRNVFDAVLEADVFKHLRHVGPRSQDTQQQQQQQRQDEQTVEQQQQQPGAGVSAGADSVPAMKQEQEALRELSLQPQQQQRDQQQQEQQQQLIKQEQQQPSSAQEAGTPPPPQLLQATQASNSQGLEQQQQQQSAASAGQSPDVEMAPAANSSVPGSRDAVAGGAAADGERSRCSSEVGNDGQPDVLQLLMLMLQLNSKCAKRGS